MVVPNRTGRIITFLASLFILVGLIPSLASAQYAVTNLVSNQPGKANHQDTSLINGWGVAYAPGGPFWVSDQGTGLSTLYDAMGNKQSLVVTIPSASGTKKGTPTGQVYNSTTDFVVSENGMSGPAAFIFATDDGTISGWNPSVNPTVAVIAVRTSANYTGLAIGSNNGANFLFAADNRNNKVDVYDASFHFVTSFTDSKLPAGCNPYNVVNIGGQLYVPFTTTTHSGVIDIFDTAGNFIQTWAEGGALKNPWAITPAPANFGPASNMILVGNVHDGRINVFKTNGKFLGQLKDPTKTVISISGLWALTFGGGTTINGKANQLFFAAGPGAYLNGLFGVIQFQ